MGLGGPVTSSLSYDSLGRLVRFGPSGGSEIALAYVPAPAATTHAATSVGKRTATLNGAVNPHGLPAEYRFEFGRTRASGHFTPARFAGNGRLPVAVTATLRHLTPGTTYHYRIIATTAAGTTIGSDQSFVTRGA